MTAASLLASNHLQEFFGHLAKLALAVMQHMKMPIWTFQRHLAGLFLYSAPATSRNCRGEVKSSAQRFLFDWRNVR